MACCMYLLVNVCSYVHRGECIYVNKGQRQVKVSSLFFSLPTWFNAHGLSLYPRSLARPSVQRAPGTTCAHSAHC